MTEDLQRFLGPTPGITSDHPAVTGLVARLCGDAHGAAETARRLFAFVRDTVRYSTMVPMARIEDYEAAAVLSRGRAFCVPKAALLAALCRAAGIPARLGFADIQNHRLHGQLAAMVPDGIIYHHCFAEIRLGGRWVKATPSFDAELSAAQGWRLVEFDGEAHAMLPETDLAGRPHVSYLRQHGWRDQVPLGEFLDSIETNYGEGSIERLEALVAAGAGETRP